MLLCTIAKQLTRTLSSANYQHFQEVAKMSRERRMSGVCSQNAIALRSQGWAYLASSSEGRTQGAIVARGPRAGRTWQPALRPQSARNVARSESWAHLAAGLEVAELVELGQAAKRRTRPHAARLPEATRLRPAQQMCIKSHPAFLTTVLTSTSEDNGEKRVSFRPFFSCSALVPSPSLCLAFTHKSKRQPQHALRILQSYPSLPSWNLAAVNDLGY